MAWTTPQTWDNELVTAAKLNTELGANQLALKDPPSGDAIGDEGADYTSPSSLTIMDSDFNFTLNTTGGDVLVVFTGVGIATGTRVANLAILVDGTMTIHCAIIRNISVVMNASFSHLITGLSAGSHSFVLQWQTAGEVGTATIYAGAGTANHNLHPQFWAREVS